MGLRQDAEGLIETLRFVAAGLAAFQGSSGQAEYVRHLHRRLVPLIDDLRDQIAQRADRSDILRAMGEIKEVMNEVNGAATKGEMNIFEPGVLNRFWHLSTIFQEARYRDEAL
jgi:hypothetical protein